MKIGSGFDDKMFRYWNAGPIAVKQTSRGFQHDKGIDARIKVLLTAKLSVP
jgi:hypothetical protein